MPPNPVSAAAEHRFPDAGSPATGSFRVMTSLHAARGRRHVRTASIAALLLLVAGCGSVVSGVAVQDSSVATVEGGTEAPSGLKEGAPKPTLEANDSSTSNKYDVLALSTIEDLYTFYSTEMPKEFDKKFTPAKVLQSYDSTASSAKFCGRSVKGQVNAFYSSQCDGIAWDRGELMPTLEKDVGILSVPTVLAHEMGHLVQNRLGVPRTSVILLEQQADCYAGAYWRWVSEGNSKYFTFSPTSGMRGMLAALQYVADPAGVTKETAGAHGSAFDRVFAATLGFTDGAKRCNTITQEEIDQRIKQSGFSQIPKKNGNLDVSDELIADVAKTLDIYFGQTVPGYQAPALTKFDGESAPACSGVAQAGPVVYCPATRTISYNLTQLQEIGKPSGSWSVAKGDFSAMILLASRYAIAALAGSGVRVDAPAGGLEALCYAGTWANWLRAPQGPKNLALTPNDLDKAVLQVITSPLAASDVNGTSSGSVLAQIQSFNIGVIYDIRACFDFYSNQDG